MHLFSLNSFTSSLLLMFLWQSTSSAQSSGMVKFEQASSTVALQFSSSLYRSWYSDTLLPLLVVSLLSQDILFRLPPAPSLR